MFKPRIFETEEGIQGEYDVRLFYQMARRMRDKGWLETKKILKSGRVEQTFPANGDDAATYGNKWRLLNAVITRIHLTLEEH